MDDEFGLQEARPLVAPQDRLLRRICNGHGRNTRHVFVAYVYKHIRFRLHISIYTYTQGTYMPCICLCICIYDVTRADTFIQSDALVVGSYLANVWHCLLPQLVP